MEFLNCLRSPDLYLDQVRIEKLTSTTHPKYPRGLGVNLNSKLSTYRCIGVVWVPLVESPSLPIN